MADAPREVDNTLRTWIEELLQKEADGREIGARPLNLEELERSLHASVDRRALKRRGSRAA
jgi:hypothetical protein